jgi:hypothetical protein
MPVDDTLVICVLKSRSDLRGDVPSIIEGAPSIRRRTLDQFHGECSHAVSMVDAIDRSDVWMVQRMLEARPRAKKARYWIGPGKQAFRKNRARSFGWEVIDSDNSIAPTSPSGSAVARQLRLALSDSSSFPSNQRVIH